MSVTLEINTGERIRRTTASLEAHRQGLARVEALQASRMVEQKKKSEEREMALRKAHECDEAIRQCAKAAEKLEKQKHQLEAKRKALEEEIADLAGEDEVSLKLL